jgi:hypothetical protein
MWTRLMVVAGLLGLTTPARAQILDAPREYAKAFVEATTPRWDGQTVTWPEPQPRPARAVHTLRSLEWPVNVHGGSHLPPSRLEAALEALEAAAAWLDHGGWPAPLPDGGRGGTGGFDLYLTPLEQGLVGAFMDAPVAWSHYDAASTFAVVDPAAPGDSLAACVTSAYVQAMVFGQDPAEAPPWRQATGTLAAWLLTGEWGCTNSADQPQRDPWRAWVGDGDRTDESAGGALLLAMLSERMDGGRGSFVRDLWQVARQRSIGTDDLRGIPDLWQAIGLLLDMAEQDVDETLADLAVARYFAGARDRHAPFVALRGLGPEATVPLAWRTGWQALPARSPPADPPLEPTGCAHALVDVEGAPDDSVLRIWMRGEYGVRWSLTAVRLDAEGRELSRMTAPDRKVPHSYLPVQLTEGTAHVLIVVTNLSSRLPDADIPDENVRSFQLTVDRGSPEDALGPGPQ